MGHMPLSIVPLYSAIVVDSYFEPAVSVTIKNIIFIRIYAIAGLRLPFGNIGLSRLQKFQIYFTPNRRRIILHICQFPFWPALFRGYIVSWFSLIL
jgi:hypothetical protein